MTLQRNPPSLVFDAYGTLFDVYSIGALAEDIFPGSGARIADLWRIAQIDYTRIRTLSGVYADFRQITADAFDFAAAKLNLNPTVEQRRRLLAQYDVLGTFPEVPAVLQALRQLDCTLTILSNGTPDMLSGALDASGLLGVFDHVLSVDSVRKFKTAPEAYQLALDALHQPADDIIFVSSNGWDICGAAWFGYRTFWVNRAANVLERLGVTPDGEGRSLSGLQQFVTPGPGAD